MSPHTDCEHESTPKARAKCRRERAGSTQGSEGKGGKSRSSDGVSAPTRGDGPTYGAFRSRTPRDKALACDNCGVERMRYRGTDPITNILKFVGPKCYYIVARAEDLTDLGKKAKREKPKTDLDTKVGEG